MQITVQYAAQIKAAAGVNQVSLEVEDDATVEKIVATAAELGNENLRRLLIGANGTVQPTILMFVGEECVSHGERKTLRDGDTLTLMSPISGG